jgi:nicotinate-nucleotide--dimethylbenzimidazole phosphoribosyltransferase
MTGLLEKTEKQIRPADPEVEQAARCHWDAIAHPLHSLGKLEDAIVQIAGIQGTADVRLDKKGLIIMCADNGVVAEGVTQTGQEVTAQVAENFLTDRATAAILCREAGTDIFPIDIGMARDTKVRKCKVLNGTGDIALGPAMTREDAVRAIETGIRIAQEKAEAGYKILATGEMGIGNTTTSSAMASVFLHQPVEQMTGRGAGLSSEGLERKIRVIRKSIERNRPDPEDPVDVLAKVGGLDIAGLAGVFIGGAACRIPVVIDGFISAVAALTAYRICSASVAYMLPSHMSGEPAASLVLDALSLSPFLTCQMSLGEGTGAVMLFPLLDMALKVYDSMSTFDEDGIEAYRHLS